MRAAEPPATVSAEVPAAPAVIGDERVDAAVERLTGLGSVPVDDHVEVFEDVHHRLSEILASVDDEHCEREVEHAAAPDDAGAASGVIKERFLDHGGERGRPVGGFGA